MKRAYLRYYTEKGFREEVYYMKGLKKIPALNKATAATQRVVPYINHPSSSKAWRGFVRAENFACRWSGWMTISRKGSYKFALSSDDGSRMFLGRKLLVNNDGLHGMRNVEGTVNMRTRRYFQDTPDTIEVTLQCDGVSIVAYLACPWLRMAKAMPDRRWPASTLTLGRSALKFKFASDGILLFLSTSRLAEMQAFLSGQG